VGKLGYHLCVQYIESLDCPDTFNAARRFRLRHPSGDWYFAIVFANVACVEKFERKSYRS